MNQTTVEAAGVLFQPRQDDPMALVDASGRQPVIDLTRRLRPAVRPIDTVKLTPFLGYWGQLQPGQAPEAFVVKVMALDEQAAKGGPIPPAAANLIANEEEAAKRTDLLLPGVPATGIGGGYAWVIRRYIHGLTLGQMREQGLLGGNRMRLATLLLEALVELHSRTYNGHPLFHGDIKPANVIVKSTDREISGVELIDYESGGASGAGGPVYRHATLQFASPEHFLAPHIGQPSDVFSWGLTVLDMYAPERHPFSVVSRNDPDAYRAVYASNEVADEAVLATIDDALLRDAVRQALVIPTHHRPSAAALRSRLQPPNRVEPSSRPIDVPTEIIALPTHDDESGPTHDDESGPSHADASGPTRADASGHSDTPTRRADTDKTRIQPAVDIPPPAPTQRVGPADVTQPVYTPLGEPDTAPPAPVATPHAVRPVAEADPDSIPAQMRAWWLQVVSPSGYLGAKEFDARHWAAYIGVTLLGSVVVSLLLAAILTWLWRLIIP